MTAPGLSAFFLLAPAPDGLLLATRHDPALVALSVAVAVLTSVLALQLAGVARDARPPVLRQGALVCGALALGAGVWAMHFIGMLAFQVCTTVAYPPLHTAASVLPSLLAAGVAMHVLARPRLRGPRLLASGVLIGAGIGLMHYSGMAALDTGAALRYDPAWFALSIVVAVALAVAALWLRFGLVRQRRLAPWAASLAGGTVLGLAISGMHYTAMAATRFVGAGDTAVPLPARPLGLALAVAATTVLVCLLALAVHAGLRYWQMIRELHRSQARLRATLDTAGDGILSLDEQGRLLDLNRAAEQVLDWPAASALGRPIAERLPALATLVPGQQLLVMRRPDGRERTLRVTLAPAWQAGQAESLEPAAPLLPSGPTDTVDRLEPSEPDGDGGLVAASDGLWVAFLTDLTDARAREAEFEGVVQAVHRGLMVIEFGLDGRVLQASGLFLDLMGYRAEALVGQPHAVLCRPEEVASPAYAEHWAALRRGEFRTGDFVRVRQDGRPVWIRATYNPILDAQGRPLRVMKFVSDLTERHALEQDLRLAKDRAEQAAQAKSSFLANMSHEIRTPMNAIIGFAELVLEGPLTDEVRGHLQTIRRSARGLLGLINDILDTAKLEHGAVTLEQRPFSLHTLCRDLLATLGLGARAKGLQLTLDGAPDLPDAWIGDALRLQQVLLNLLGNAIKFTERGRVQLVVRAATLAEHGVDGLLFAVEDTGIGIPADRLDRIFDPFAQADASMTRRYGGTGLGTTIARQLVQLMGGRIGVHSVPGEGSRFWFTLPLQPGVAVAPGEGGEANAEPTGGLPALRPLRILVADDVAENLALLQVRLGRLGHRVLTAGDGAEAVALLQRETLDLALMDVQMPVLDGLAATRRLRAWEAAQGRPPLPVIALTAGVLAADRQDTLAAGMSGFAVKPVDLPQLLAEVLRVLGPAALQPVAAAVPGLGGPMAAAGAPATGLASAGEAAPRPRPSSAPDKPPAVGQPPSASLPTGVARPPGAALPPGRDWTDGLRRWGSATVLREQLLRHAARALADLPADGPWPPPDAAALAHRLKGAAANLGLADLAAAADALARPDERDEPARTSDAAGMARAAAWQALRAELLALQQALLASAPADTATVTATLSSAAPAPAVTPVAGSASAPVDWPRLRARLAAGELDEQLLQPALAALAPPVRQALREALDGFDFDLALAVLARGAPEALLP